MNYDLCFIRPGQESQKIFKTSRPIDAAALNAKVSLMTTAKLIHVAKKKLNKRNTFKVFFMEQPLPSRITYLGNDFFFL